MLLRRSLYQQMPDRPAEGFVSCNQRQIWCVYLLANCFHHRKKERKSGKLLQLPFSTTLSCPLRRDRLSPAFLFTSSSAALSLCCLSPSSCSPSLPFFFPALGREGLSPVSFYFFFLSGVLDPGICWPFLCPPSLNARFSPCLLHVMKPSLSPPMQPRQSRTPARPRSSSGNTPVPATPKVSVALQHVVAGTGSEKSAAHARSASDLTSPADLQAALASPMSPPSSSSGDSPTDAAVPSPPNAAIALPELGDDHDDDVAIGHHAQSRQRPLQEQQQRIKVCVRCRPLNQTEAVTGSTVVPIFDERRGCVTIPIGRQSRSFFFDHVFTPSSSQEDVYETVTAGMVPAVLDGYNSTFLAYGQSSSGKTYTVLSETGIVPRCVMQLFADLAKITDRHYVVECSFAQIYNEAVFDLLSPSSSTPLQIREHPVEGVFVEGLSLHPCASGAQVLTMLKEGRQRIIYAETYLNMHSSRSHSIFEIRVRNTTATPSYTGKLSLYDLAGSERLSKSGTGNDADRFEETRNINSSLTTLGMCVAALAERASFVPYRDSKLTRLLQESLGGNSKTVLIVCISPSASHLNESMNTCRFGQRAKKVEMHPVVNIAVDYKTLSLRLQEEIDRLKDSTTQTVLSYESAIADLRRLVGYLSPVESPAPGPEESQTDPGSVSLEEMLVLRRRLDMAESSLRQIEQEDILREATISGLACLLYPTTEGLDVSAVEENFRLLLQVLKSRHSDDIDGALNLPIADLQSHIASLADATRISLEQQATSEAQSLAEMSLTESLGDRCVAEAWLDQIVSHSRAIGLANGLLLLSCIAERRTLLERAAALERELAHAHKGQQTTPLTEDSAITAPSAQKVHVAAPGVDECSTQIPKTPAAEAAAAVESEQPIDASEQKQEAALTAATPTSRSVDIGATASTDSTPADNGGSVDADQVVLAPVIPDTASTSNQSSATASQPRETAPVTAQRSAAVQTEPVDTSKKGCCCIM